MLSEKSDKVEEDRGGSVSSVSLEDSSFPEAIESLATTTEEDEDCVIVEPTEDCVIVEPSIIRECSSRDDDDGPLSSSSPFSRMEITDNTTALLRFPDDRSDSGVSSLRSGSCASGDERSGSRSSALSSSDEPTHLTNRSPFAPNTTSSAEPVRVWRDPTLLLEAEPHVRHIDSVQHQTLLMSHPGQTPQSSAASRSEAPASSAAATAHLYQSGPPPPPPLLSQYHHHAAAQAHAAAAAAAHHMPLPEMLWKRYPPIPVGSHLLVPPNHPASNEELMERERAYDRERMHR